MVMSRRDSSGIFRRIFASAFVVVALASTAYAQATKAAPEVYEDVALPMVHVPIPVFWAAMCTGFAVGLGFGVVFTLCWRRQMSIDKFGSDFGEFSFAGSRSTFQKSEEYRRRELCPLCPWMANLRL